MVNKPQVFIGAVIILIGVVSLIGTMFDIDVGALFCPVALIAAGVLLLLRPQLLDPGTPGQLMLLGDVRRRGVWGVADEDIWSGVGNVLLDMSGADVPVGETHVRVYNFVGDVRVSVPEGVGVSVSCMAFVTDARVLGRRRDYFLTPFELSSDDYEAAERRIRLDVLSFVGSLRVRQVQVEGAPAGSGQPESTGEPPVG
jgi:hypothetical protein